MSLLLVKQLVSYQHESVDDVVLLGDSILRSDRCQEILAMVNIILILVTVRYKVVSISHRKVRVRAA